MISPMAANIAHPVPAEAGVDVDGSRYDDVAVDPSVVAMAGLSLGSASVDEPDTYKMDHSQRGHFLLFNNKYFEEGTGKPTRTGTDVDASQLYVRFKELGFQVHLHNDLSCRDMLQVIKEVSKEDHTSADCFACAILSHGEPDAVYGRDGIIEIKILVEPLKAHLCPQLAGKPKLFIIQACRGSELDPGVDVADVADCGEETRTTSTIPTEADVLFAFSTVQGYMSWRNKAKGSWFVQALSKAMQKYRDKDIVQILTRVNHILAYEFESNLKDESMNKKRQISSIVSMLTKDLYLTPK